MPTVHRIKTLKQKTFTITTDEQQIEQCLDCGTFTAVGVGLACAPDSLFPWALVCRGLFQRSAAKFERVDLPEAKNNLLNGKRIFAFDLSKQTPNCEA